MRIGPYALSNNLVVAPMAGVTDRPFRLLCKRFGAGHAISEMVASKPELRGTEKSRRRTDHAGEPAPVAVATTGAELPPLTGFVYAGTAVLWQVEIGRAHV
jgi:tRNA-dihydrouridine synthase B